MDDIILSQAEMLAVMAAVGTSLIPLIDNDRLVPDGQAAQRELTLHGLAALQARGLLRQEAEQMIMDGDLGMIGMALAFPQVVLILARDNPGLGRQQFLQYWYDPVQIELTMPTETQYRLAPLPDLATALERARQILPVSFTDTPAFTAETMPTQPFFAAKTAAEQGNTAAALALFTQAGWAAATAQQFIATLQQPTLGGTLSLLRLVDQEVVDGRDLALVQDDTVAWLIRPQTPGEDRLVIEPVTAVAYSTAIIATLNSLLEAVE